MTKTYRGYSLVKPKWENRIDVFHHGLCIQTGFKSFADAMAYVDARESRS